MGRPGGLVPRRPKSFIVSIYFLLAELMFFWVVFFFLSLLSPFLMFGGHHFPSSCLSHSPPPTTKLGNRLPHVPMQPPAPCLCMLRVVFPSKTLPSLHPAHSVFVVPYKHWNRCFDGCGRVFRAVFGSAGPPQSPLHTCTVRIQTCTLTARTPPIEQHNPKPILLVNPCPRKGTKQCKEERWRL